MKVGIIGSARGCVKTELLNHVPGATVVDLHEDHRSQISNVRHVWSKARVLSGYPAVVGN
jgi:hypothetical protein